MNRRHHPWGRAGQRFAAELKRVAPPGTRRGSGPDPGRAARNAARDPDDRRVALAGDRLRCRLSRAAAGAAIAVIYKIFPPEPLEGRQILRGTAFTAAGVSILSLAFSLYLTFGANFQERYATSGLAGIVLVAVWLFVANTLLLLGYRVALKTPEGKKRSRTSTRSRTGKASSHGR
ncbi:MAG: YihY/virulence factor BrkB family protein [Actinomycetota bacterium]|nr:YihY/virulence factor BrkB family protein [Actinomycetota bacterium]